MTPGCTRNSAPLWVRGQDAFLVIRRSRDRSQLATQTFAVRRHRCWSFDAIRSHPPNCNSGDPDVMCISRQGQAACAVEHVNTPLFTPSLPFQVIDQSPQKILQTEDLGGLCNSSMTPGFTRNSAPLWVRGQDTFLVICRLRDRSELATQTFAVRRHRCWSFEAIRSHPPNCNTSFDLQKSMFLNLHSEK